jgi:type I restriction enzyme M protein
MSTFSEAKQKFDKDLGKSTVLKLALVPVDGNPKKDIPIRNVKGETNEEYYKWQFIYALINSGLYPKDYIGVEVRFPKGSKTSAPLKLDGAVFDDPDWITRYHQYWLNRKAEDLEWLNSHLLAVIEFKKGDKEIDKVFTGQVKPAMKEKDPATAYVLGIYYDTERLYLFHRRDGFFLRYDEAKNQKGDQSQIGDLTLHLPDQYLFIPSFTELKSRVYRPSKIDRSKRSIYDLDIITSIAATQMRDALSNVLRTLDMAGLVNQRGYGILIQTFALKIFDEKRNERASNKPLEFYITDEERDFRSLPDQTIQRFIKRMKGIRDDALGQYPTILQRTVIDWKEPDHVRAVVAACANFQDFSFVRSSKSDLYQLVFYNFANQFQQQEKAQFLTPLAVIDFLVKVVNPRNGETVFDPCCGIADFLSLSYVNSQAKAHSWRLDDANIFGADVSGEMITLASLNMLLNGDGRAHLFRVPDKGSILWKIKSGNPPEPVELIPEHHKAGNWDDWPDSTRLMKFDVILTNPPFGEDRAYRPKTEFDRRVIEMYQTWNITRNIVDEENGFDAEHKRGKGGKPKSKGVEGIDLGVVFLENGYRCLKEEGRIGIVLSNSIGSINRWQKVREWLIERMRVTALFDLPPNVFAETGVNTTLIVAYKPTQKELKRLKEQGYSVFVRDIQNVGYEKRTSKRNVFFNPSYRIDDSTFEIMTDDEGNPIVEEDFTQTLVEFRQWVLGQEKTLQRLFLKEE